MVTNLLQAHALPQSTAGANRFTPAIAQFNRRHVQKGNAMQCVNPECCEDAQDLHTGTLRLLELAVPPEERIVRSDSGFPIVVVPSRYFWLCSQCSRIWKMKRWTAAGLILEPHAGADLPDAGRQPNSLTVKIAPARETPQSRVPALSDLVA